jgi:hypothetical protein
MFLLPPDKISKVSFVDSVCAASAIASVTSVAIHPLALDSADVSMFAPTTAFVIPILPTDPAPGANPPFLSLLLFIMLETEFIERVKPLVFAPM